MIEFRLGDVEIVPLTGAEEAHACATIMHGSDPWLRLGRSYERCLGVLQDPDAEVYVARAGTAVVGFIVLIMRGAFSGYIRSIAVRSDLRSHGLGARLMSFAEERIYRDSPNVFICVSSFNDRARAFYLRLGYEVIGELKDFIVRGSSEWLLRKTKGPLYEFFR